MKQQELAQALYDAFVTSTRTDGVKFIHTAPEHYHKWVPLIRAAHCDMSPDDLRYSMIKEVAGRLADTDPEKWEDWRSEIVDGLVDVYNYNRVMWLASNLWRGEYCDEAMSEYGCKDRTIYEVIGWGQAREYDEIYGILMDHFNSMVEETADHE